MPRWIPVFDRVYRVIEILERGDEIGFFEFVPDGNPELVRFAQRALSRMLTVIRGVKTIHTIGGVET
ncbi:hypothetical protein [Halorubrum tropicale]|uniref:hypothetical protein n=1 Tax=Halorubrum tropicale TaxID=1765655 RepID=UPI001F0B4FDA|nr:hypothetical protein [Halorubrum tropicale]